MTATNPQPHGVARSIVALLAGLFAAVILSIGTDILMYAIGVLPRLGEPAGNNALLLATAYRTVYGIGGSYIAARLAPNRPMGHALTLGVLGLIVSIVGAVVTWNRQPSLGPHWYPVALVMLAIPTAWAGGKLRVMQLHRAAGGVESSRCGGTRLDVHRRAMVIWRSELSYATRTTPDGTRSDESARSGRCLACPPAACRRAAYPCRDLPGCDAQSGL